MHIICYHNSASVLGAVNWYANQTKVAFLSKIYLEAHNSTHAVFLNRNENPVPQPHPIVSCTHSVTYIEAAF